MLDHALWQEKIKTDLGNTVRFVGFASNIKEVLKSAVKRTPAVFIIPKDDRSRDKDSTTRVRSWITSGVDVLIIASDYSDAVGGAAKKSILPLRRAIFDSLSGWTPPDANSPIHFRGGARKGMHQGLLIWADTYDCQHLRG